ncbi:hypothetical protein Fot_30586 [Forsythia ovata]|uniref:Response regulatory domain-containing protein n=1 Tax=Forsythia ovata TaxID=205694 RepID=A0ABD1TV71_9LAMI
MGRKVCKSTFLHSLLCGKKILVVDDNKVNLRVAAGALKKLWSCWCTQKIVAKLLKGKRDAVGLQDDSKSLDKKVKCLSEDGKLYDEIIGIVGLPSATAFSSNPMPTMSSNI